MLQSLGLQRVGYDWTTEQFLHIVSSRIFISHTNISSNSRSVFSTSFCMYHKHFKFILLVLKLLPLATTSTTLLNMLGKKSLMLS